MISYSTILKSVKSICRENGTNPLNIMNETRKPKEVMIRHAFWLAIKTISKKNYSVCELAHSFNRDHSTVIEAQKRFAERINPENRTFDGESAILYNKVKFELINNSVPGLYG